MDQWTSLQFFAPSDMEKVTAWSHQAVPEVSQLEDKPKAVPYGSCQIQIQNTIFSFPLPPLPAEEAQGRRMGRRRGRVKLSPAANRDSPEPAMRRDGKDVIQLAR